MTLIGDGSMELQSISTNNNIPLSSINSASAEQPSVIPKEESLVTTDHPSSETNAPSPNGAAGPVRNGKPLKMVTSTRSIVILSIVAAVLIVSGVALGLCWMLIYNSILHKQLVLTPTSTSYDIWKEIPIPMYLNLYLYNWTNPEMYTTWATEKPNFVETGPYVFREEHVKVNKTWNENGTITFQQRRIWHFEESMSNGSLDDEITNVNVLAVTVGDFVRNETRFIRRLISGTLIHYNQSLAITKTARELLFEGYQSDLLDFARNLTNFIPFDKFGWFYERNGSDTYDGVFNMHTGVEDISNLGVLDRWNYRHQTDFWYGNCSIIRGTTGELWPPLTDNESVELFAPDICTSMTLSRIEDASYLDVSGHKFVADTKTFDNGTNVPARACYCDQARCFPSGILGVSQCKFGAPAYVSLPHFHLADEYYSDAVTGLDPLNEDHNFELTLEPNTGIPLNVRAQMQINLLLEPISDIDLFTDIPQTFIPVLWFRQEALLTDDFARQIKVLLMIPKLGDPICITIACVGLALGLTALYLCWVKRSRAGENQLLIGKQDNSEATRAEPVVS